MNAVSSILGSRPVSAMSTALTRNRLRVLAYHGIADQDAFAAQLDHLSTRYTTVIGSDVRADLDGSSSLPDRALWITFDDGEPEIVRVGLPLLRERGMRATAFVCAGLIDTETPQWWETVRMAADRGLLRREDTFGETNAEAVAALKQVPDSARRATIEELNRRLRSSGEPATQRQLTSTELLAWVAAGCEVGNHSWDHPCLDRCSDDEQRQQIQRADQDLTRILGTAPTVFAWPNGNIAPAALAALKDLDYRLVLGFDHRICAKQIDPWAVSRLRIDSDADIPRLRSIVSGAHSSVFQLHAHARRRRRGQHDRT